MRLRDKIDFKRKLFIENNRKYIQINVYGGKEPKVIMWLPGKYGRE